MKKTKEYEECEYYDDNLDFFDISNKFEEFMFSISILITFLIMSPLLIAYKINDFIDEIFGGV